MTDFHKPVQCDQHGARYATFVCQHLVGGTGLGFHWGSDPDDPDDPCPDAWCDSCEASFQAEGEWNERSEAAAGISLLCDRCYERARQHNWREDGAAFDRLRAESIAYLHDKQDLLRDRYRLNDHERYDWDQDSGQLVFSTRGQTRVVADVQFVGTISTVTNTWLWSWANGSLLEEVRREVRAVRAYGEEHGFLKLAAAHWDAVHEDGWEMAAITAFLLRADGAYRSPDERGFTFLILKDVRWAQ